MKYKAFSQRILMTTAHAADKQFERTVIRRRVRVAGGPVSLCAYGALDRAARGRATASGDYLMRYLRTKISTDFRPRSLGDRVFGALLYFVPRANPDYEPKLHLVREWLVEFNQDDRPDREIGLDATGSPIVAGPTRRNYGFWLDTNMLFKDFAGEPITKELFEAQWSKFHTKPGNSVRR